MTTQRRRSEAKRHAIAYYARAYVLLCAGHCARYYILYTIAALCGGRRRRREGERIREERDNIAARKGRKERPDKGRACPKKMKDVDG